MRPLLVVLATVLLFFASAEAGAQQPAEAAAMFVVHVDEHGSLSVAGDATDDFSVIAQATAALNRDVDTLLVVEANSRAPSQGVTRAAQLLQQSGARKISFRTAAPTQQ